MKARKQSRFDVETLRDHAGDKAFMRGEAYFRDGQVVILDVSNDRVLAQVEGTETYRTELTGRGNAIGGNCSCPAFDRGFCKHMVATALAANETGGEAADGALARIRDHLKRQSPEALAQMIVNIAERDAALFRKLDLAASAQSSNPKELEQRLRKAIDGATRAASYIDYRAAPAWAGGVNSALDAIESITEAIHAGMLMRLAEHAVDRIDRALGSMDDSDGYGGELLHRAAEIHLSACRAAKPDPLKLAGNLFARKLNGDYDAFNGAAARCADILSEKGLAEYRRLAVDAWKALPTPSKRNDFSMERYRLKDMLDFFAERDGDIEARIALRAESLSSSWDYLQLAELCLQHGREDEALSRAEEGLWVLEDERPDPRLISFTVDLLVKRKRTADAEALLWKAFQKAPSFDLYKRLRELGGEGVRQRAISQLEAKAAKAAKSKVPSWASPLSLLIEILVHEKLLEEAWTAAGKYGASLGLKESLAQASEQTHPAEAAKVYLERIDELANLGGNPSYADAARLVARLAKLQTASEHAAYLADLKAKFIRRRNFVKLLD